MLAEVTKKQTNLAHAIANLDDAEAMEPLTRELSILSEQKRRLLSERDAVLARAGEWKRAEDRLHDVEAWIGKLSTLVDDLDCGRRRQALDALGIAVRVFGIEESPRFVITAALPFPAAPPTAAPDAIVFPSSRG